MNHFKPLIKKFIFLICTTGCASSTKFEVNTVCNEKFVDLQVASGSSCARTSSGSIVCWGSCFKEDSCRWNPHRLNIPHDSTQWFTSLTHVCARSSDGIWSCWRHGREYPDATIQIPQGANFVQEGRFGIYALENNVLRRRRIHGKNEPIEVESILGQVNTFSSTNVDACAIMEDGKVVCWPGISDEERFYTIPVTNAQSVSSNGTYGGCGLVEGEIFCWDWSLNVKKISSEIKIKNLASSIGQACGISQNNEVFCWDTLLQRNQSKSTKLNSKQSMNIERLVASPSHMCALDKSGFVFCWGDSSNGQLGDTIRNKKSIENPSYISACQAK